MEETMLPEKLQEKKKKNLRNFQYILDKSTGLFYKPDCANCSAELSEIQGFGTLKGCVRNKLSPCVCCKKDVDDYAKATPYNSRKLPNSLVAAKILTTWCYTFS